MIDPRAVVAQHFRNTVRSLFFYPALAIVVAFIAFAVTTLLDQRFEGAFAGFQESPLTFLVFAGDAQAARSVLAAIATMWATITGVVYSVTLVTVQLSASKYTAEVIPRFEQDRRNRVVLATYVGTVAYSLFVLKTVRVEDPAFAPVIGVNVSIVLAITALFMLVAFIANLTSYMRPKRFVDDLAESVLRDAHARQEHDSDGGAQPLYEKPVAGEDAVTHAVRAPVSGYVTGLDVDEVVRAADRLPPGTVVRLRATPGVRVEEGDRVFTVHVPPRSSPTIDEDGSGGSVAAAARGGKSLEKSCEELAHALVIAASRTLEGDPGLGVKTLQDIALTTLLSPTDTAVAERCVSALMRLAAWEAERDPPPRGLVVHDVKVDLDRAPLLGDVLRRAKQVHDAACERGLWVLTESLVRDVTPVLERLAARADYARYRQVLDFVETVLVDAFTRLHDDQALARVVDRLREVADDLAADEHRAFAGELRLMLTQAAAGARRVDADALGPHASRALERAEEGA